MHAVVGSGLEFRRTRPYERFAGANLEHPAGVMLRTLSLAYLSYPVAYP